MTVLIRSITYASLFSGLILVFLPAQVLSRSGVTWPTSFGVAQLAGMIVAAAGATIAVWCILAFALVGHGTPAPFDPPRRLVVRGPYRVVRNPMYIAVTALIAGQGLLFGSVTVLEYGAIVWAGFFLFVVAYEEPALGEQFADEYKRYRANVRRWLPRITPWRE